MAKTTIINVSNRLPVTVGEKEITKSSGGLVAALAGLSAEKYDLKWIGWPGGDVPDPARREEVTRALTQEHGCIPVYLNAEEAEAHYEGFSNSSIWPLLHYMPNYLRYEPAWWEHYRNVNQRFADQVLEIAGEDDLVWVHDYHLLLLPALLKQARPTLKIGFFLHTPFPAYEIFRCHPRRSELVAGMLGADRIGFHTFGYARHFRSTVQRLLGLDSEITRIPNPDGHSTALGVYPIGIHAEKFRTTLDSPEFAQRREAFRASHGGKRLVVAVERMDYTKGILHRLDAIDVFLGATDAAARENLKFIFVSVPSREAVEEYQTLREEVESRVGRLNGKYATLHNSPVHFIHGSVEFPDLCALYALAEVALVTPLIDGMNLVAKEFIACQGDGDDAGVLILSEFAGAAEELFNAQLVNPYDLQSVADNLTAALAMPAAERRARIQPMRDRVMKHDAQRWAQTFIEDLAATPGTEAGGTTTSLLTETGDRLAQALTSGRRVALFLDYDGTLRELERDPAGARPGPELRELLDALARRSDLHVTIISGRVPADLEAWLGDYPFALVAEHGASLRRPGGREWEETDRNIGYAWKAELLSILRQYEDSTPGSFVEEKRTSLVWHYRRADVEFGAWKANQLVEELALMTANEPVEIRHGKKIVEIASTLVNKGAAVSRLLEETPHDLVLCAGDDQTDESMFRLDPANLLSVKVGPGPTLAKYQVASPAGFRRFLQRVLDRTGPRADAADTH